MSKCIPIKNGILCFDVFAELHPVEAYDLDRKAFYKFMKNKMPVLSKKTIDRLMVETKVEIKATE